MRVRDVRTGRVTAATLRDVGVPRDAEVYICGPAAFMTELRTVFGDCGVPAERIHVELFGALEAINPGIVGGQTTKPHPPASVPVGAGETTRRVTFARSGLDVDWAPEHETLLELAEACDVPTRWACRTGVCHTCVTPIVTGDVDYVVPPLDPPQPGEALICCSRPRGDVVLEL